MLICWIVIYPMDSIIQSILSVQTYRHTLNTDISLLQTVCFVPLHFLYKRNPNNHTPLSILMGFDWGHVHVAAARRRSHQWCISLTPNNTKTSGRMTCHCFLATCNWERTSKQLLHYLLSVLHLHRANCCLYGLGIWFYVHLCSTLKSKPTSNDHIEIFYFVKLDLNCSSIHCYHKQR